MPAASSQAFREARFYSCPVAEGLDPDGWVGRALEIFRWSGRGERVSEVIAEPSLATWQTVDILNAELDAIDDLHAQILRDREDAKNRAKNAKRR